MANRIGPRVAIALLCSAGAAFAQADAPRILKLSSDVWPPFTDIPGNARVAVELVQTALDRGGVKTSTEIRQDFTDLIDDLREGKIDGSPAVWRTPAREKFLLYSQPYLENRLVLVGRKGSDLSAVALSLLPGKRIGIVRGYGYGAAVENVKGPVFVEGPSDSENLKKLLRGEVDYVLADELVVHHLFKSYGDKAGEKLAAGVVPLLDRSLHFVVRRDLPGAAAIMQRFDAEIRAMVRDGSYNRILQVDWIRADVDGDGVVELVLGGSEAGVLPPTSSYELFEMGKPQAPEGEGVVRYYVEGRPYDSWEDVPPEYKIPRKHGLEPGRPGIVLFEF